MDSDHFGLAERSRQIPEDCRSQLKEMASYLFSRRSHGFAICFGNFADLILGFQPRNGLIQKFSRNLRVVLVRHFLGSMSEEQVFQSVASLVAFDQGRGGLFEGF